MKKKIFFFVRSGLKSNALINNFNYFVKNSVLVEYDVNMIYYQNKFFSILIKARLLRLYLFILKVLFKPDLILFMDERASLSLSRIIKETIKVKTVNFSHALVSQHRFYKEIDFDYYLVYGDKCVKADEKFGVNFNATDLVAIGPFYAVSRLLLRGLNPEDNLKIFQASQQSYSFKVCVTSQWLTEKASSEQLLQTYNSISSYIKKSSDIIFFIKPHPLEKDGKNPLADCYKLDNVVVLSNESSIGDLFGMVDVNLTSYSNSALDFALIGIPTIFFAPESGICQKYGIAPKEYHLLFENLEEIDEAIRNKTFSRKHADEILMHNTSGISFEAISNFQTEIKKIIAS